MARLGNNGEVSISVDTTYNGKGMEQAKKDMEAMSLKMKAELEKGTSHLDRMRQSVEGIKGAWAELLAAYGAVRFLAAVAQEALQAEIAFRKLRTQVEMTGVSWQAVSREVDAAITSSARYARVQKEEVADSMRQLVWATGDYRKALENLNLVQDLAYQTNMSTSEATRLVSMALTGNLEMLGRVKPEFRNLDEILGKYRTTADEVAYFYAVMKEKVEGATQAMTEHEKMARDMNLLYKDIRESLGGIVNDMNAWAFQMLTFGRLKDSYKDAAQAFQNILNELRHGEHMARVLAGEYEHPVSKYIEEVGKKAEKSSKQIAEESMLRSEQAEKLKKIAELNKSLASSTADLHEQINKLTMDEQAYYEWKKQDLLQKGMDLKLVNEHIDALKGLAAAEAEVRKEKELTRLMEQMKKQGGQGGGPSTSFDIPDRPLTEEEEAHKRMLQRKAEEAEVFNRTNEEIIRSEQVRANLVGIAYQAMQDQMLSLIETGKFSVGAMAKVIAQQVKIELTGIAARAAVWAIFHTAMGIGRAAFGDAKGAALHFASAAKFAATAGMAMAGAAVVHAAFGGTAERPAPGTIGGEPIRTTPAESQQPAEKPAPSITIQIYNPMGNEDWDRLAEEQIVPAIRRASGRNINI